MVDTVIVDKSAEESKEDPKHVEAMVAAVDKAAEEPDQGAEEKRPEWLPEKFDSPEALAKAYAELEAKQSAPKEPPKEPAKEDAEGDTPDAEAAKAAVESQGLSFEEFSQEYAANGELSEGSYKKLEDAGIPKGIVDQFIEGQRAVASRLESEVKNVVGGDEQFQALASWAMDNLSEAELNAYNRVVNTGDLDQIKLAVTGLQQKYQEANPTEPRLIQGGGGRVTGDVYESIEQLRKDMASPDYKNDPAYRRKVQEKLGRSSIL